MASRVQKNLQQRAANLSFQLLKTSATDPSFFSKKSIQSLQELGKRVMIANQHFENKREDNESAKQWSSQKGVNLNELREVARKLKNEQNKQNKQRTQTQEFGDWNQLEYQNFNELSPEDFLFKCEQRLAYYSIMSSLTNTKPTSHLSNLRKQHFNSIAFDKLYENNQKKEKKVKKIEFDHNRMMKQIKANYFLPNTLVPFHEICDKTELIRNKLWFRILYNQIQMTQQVEGESDKRNFILITSLKQLEAINQIHNEDKSNYTNQYWRSVYNQYRKGQSNFRSPKNQQYQQILNNLKSIQEKIQNFSNIDTPNFIQISNKDYNHKHLLALKCILKGKFIEDTADNILDQTWLLIFSEGLNRNGRQDDQNSRFKQNAKCLIEKYMQDKQDYFEKILTCLIALGAYEELVKFYRTLKSENSMSEGEKIVFSFIFALLSNNIELVQNLNLNSTKINNELEKSKRKTLDSNKNSQIVQGRVISNSTICLVRDFFEQLSEFAQLNKQDQQSYRFYLKILAQAAQEAEKQYKSLKKLDIFSLLAQQLTPNLQDLTFMSKECSATYRLSKSLLSKIRPYKVQDYLELAKLCENFANDGEIEVVDDVFIRFILLEQANEGQNEDITPYENRSQGAQIMRRLLRVLGECLTVQNKYLVKFVTSFRQLKQLLLNKDYDELTSRQKFFEKYLEDQKLLDLLSNFCQKERITSLDIYVKYCQQIKLMWKYLYLQRRQIEQLRKKYQQLAKLLKSYEKKYFFLKGVLLAELISELEK